MAKALYGYDAFDKYLCRELFTLYLDQRPQLELLHHLKKTLARFWAAALDYNFVIQDKTGSGLPLFLRATSPSQVHAPTLTIQQVLKLQDKDPDLWIIQHFHLSKSWPDPLQLYNL